MPRPTPTIYDSDAVRWIDRNLLALDDERLDRRYTLRQVVQAFVAGRQQGRLLVASNDDPAQQAT